MSNREQVHGVGINETKIVHKMRFISSYAIQQSVSGTL